MKNENQVCANCKYFKQHYVMADSGTFITTRMGHCVNGKVSNYVSAKHVQKNEGCDLWQSYELQKLHLQYCIEERVERVCKYIEEILAILRNVE